MRTALRRRLVESQVLFFGCLAVDVALSPGYLWSTDEGGVSNFGVHARTVAPFTAGFLGCAALLVLAARHAPRTPDGRRLACALWAVGATLGASTLSTYPYRHGPVAHGVHLALGTVAMGTEGVCAAWMALGPRRGRVDLVALAAVTAGVVVALLAATGVLRLLFAAQVLEAAGFAVLVLRVPGRLRPGAPPAAG